MFALLLAVVAFVAVIRLSYRLQVVYAMSLFRLPTTINWPDFSYSVNVHNY